MPTDATLARQAAATWPRYLDWEAACAYLSVSRRALYRWVRLGLPAIRVGRGQRGQLRFDRLRVDAWLADRTLSTGPVPQSRRVA